MFKCINLLFLSSVAQVSFAQDTKVSVGVQLNPFVNFSSPQVSDASLGKMKSLNVGTGYGIEVNYQLNTRLAVTPFFKFYKKSQRIEQREFYGYLNDVSYTWNQYKYENFEPGLLLKYTVVTYKSNNLYLIGGLSYSFADLSGLSGGYHFYGDNPQTVHLGAIDYYYLPGDLGTKINMWHPLAGLRGESKIRGVGVFEYGLLFFIPTKSMPEYTYDQVLTTNDKGQIHSDVTYRSIQYSTEISLVYHLFNFDKKLRPAHPRTCKLP
jgi:hypothetical protein